MGRGYCNEKDINLTLVVIQCILVLKQTNQCQYVFDAYVALCQKLSQRDYYRKEAIEDTKEWEKFVVLIK